MVQVSHLPWPTFGEFTTFALASIAVSILCRRQFGQCNAVAGEGRMLYCSTRSIKWRPKVVLDGVRSPSLTCHAIGDGQRRERKRSSYIVH